jgi:hypothetical protein
VFEGERTDAQKCTSPPALCARRHKPCVLPFPVACVRSALHATNISQRKIRKFLQYNIHICNTRTIIDEIIIETHPPYAADCMLHAACCMLHAACCMLHAADCTARLQKAPRHTARRHGQRRPAQDSRRRRRRRVPRCQCPARRAPIKGACLSSPLAPSPSSLSGC